MVRYTDLLQNLEPTIARIVEFLEIEPSAEFLEEVRAQAERQRTYQSGHKHSPDKFGLSPERIRKDLAFVYEAYGLADKAMNEPDPAVPPLTVADRSGGCVHVQQPKSSRVETLSQ